MIRRQKGMHFSNAFVFPGGSTDPPDSDPAWLRITSSAREKVKKTVFSEEIDLATLRITAIRETWEETGVLLTDKKIASGTGFLESCIEGEAVPAIEKLHYFSRIIAPKTEKKRFDTTFFICIEDSQSIQLDFKESDHFLWASPKFFLDEYFKGSAVLWPPQIYLLKVLSTMENLTRLFNFVPEIKKIPLLFQIGNWESGFVELVLPGDHRHEYTSQELVQEKAENSMIIANNQVNLMQSPKAEDFMNSLIQP
jgi:8-oxo-dGTP pyrophosphatase MutT (NUDIX family)